VLAQEEGLEVDSSTAHEFILSLLGDSRFDLEHLLRWIRDSATKTGAS
jgi:hypothetical protein